MKSVYYIAAIVVAGLLCAGCRITSSPAACGVVLDSKTHEPVSGAQVAVAYSEQPGSQDLSVPVFDWAVTNTRPPVVVTGTYGEFNIPRQRIWMMTPMQDWHAYGTLLILRDGYKMAMIPVSDTNNLDLQSETYY